MSWHAEMLYNDKNIDVAARILRRGSNVFGLDDETREDQARSFHLLYMMMNALFLEYRFRASYHLPMKEFDDTVRNALSGIVLHEDERYRVISEKLWDLFQGFPPEFREAVDRTLSDIRETGRFARNKIGSAGQRLPMADASLASQATL